MCILKSNLRKAMVEHYDIVLLFLIKAINLNCNSQMLPAKVENITCQTEKAKVRSWALTSVSSSIIKTAKEKESLIKGLKYMGTACNAVLDKLWSSYNK